MNTLAKVDGYKRIRIPDAKPGQDILIQSTPNGWTLLKRIPEPPMAKVRLVKEDGFTVLSSDKPFDETALKEALEDFPP